MWKIKNDSNKNYLDKFETEIIINTFHVISEIVSSIENGRITLPIETMDVWRQTHTIQSMSEELKDLFSYMMNKTVSGKKLQEILYLIAVTHDSESIEKKYKLYKEQNGKVLEGDYNIQPVPLDEDFKELFVSFFYNTFFADDHVWSVLVGEQYKRKSFHRNFKTENSMSVCPYCDIDTTIAGSNNNVEHFLPKSKYPLLAMNPFNLISSCYACNKAEEGMGDRIPDFPIISPYNDMIGDYAKFDIDFISKKITLKNIGGEDHHNYFNFLKLYSRYSDQCVYETVDHVAHSVFETLSNYSSPTKEAINLYLQRRSKTNNLSFALKSVIDKYSEYELYK